MIDESDDDDSAAFRAAMRNVRKIESRSRVTPGRQPPPPRARFAREARGAGRIGSLPPVAAALDVEGAEPLSFRRPGLQDSVLRRLRRGQFPVEREIDLHGLTAAQADAALRGFLARALERGVRCVRIIHGKGHRSGERGPVLKATVNALLRRSPPVMAFVSASPEQGGTGATCVLLEAARAPGARG